VPDRESTYLGYVRGHYRFVRRRASTIQSKRVQLIDALRSFPRFARIRRHRNGSCACIPAVATEAVDLLVPFPEGRAGMNSVDRKTAWPPRLRDLLILARLGLRAGEIRALTLEDLDWKEGLITVRGKAGAFPSYHYQKTSGGDCRLFATRAAAANSRCVFLARKRPRRFPGAI